MVMDLQYIRTGLPPPPQNYIDDTFRIFADNGITCVRVTFYWESWELNANQCREDLDAIGEAADKYGVICIYDNHQWKCSSWIGCGIGMPNSLMSRYFENRVGRAYTELWH
jgi:aryl-phospho-beta-D-glucosidase BglC (GH1 family)